jgi:hypothetical protein
MTTIAKLSYASIIFAIVASIMTVTLTTGAVPFRAGQICQRVEYVENRVDKLERMCEDVSHTRGRVDALYEMMKESRQGGNNEPIRNSN